MKSPSWLVFGVALALTVALPVIGHGKDGKDNDRPAKEWTVHFGQPQPQTPDATPPAGAQANGAQVTHFLVPNDLTIVKGDSVTFVINGGGHGVAIHPVAKNTTRADIAEDLCDGTTNDNNEANNPSVATQIANRHARSVVCNPGKAESATINGALVKFLGSESLEYMITDGKDNLIIDTGLNVVIPTTPPVIVVDNPRVDDPVHTHRLLATSGAPPAGDTTLYNAAGRAGAFLTGTAPVAPPPTPPTFTPGQRIQVHFLKTGRYLVICMNRSHSLNDHMFGFINVVGDEGDD